MTLEVPGEATYAIEQIEVALEHAGRDGRPGTAFRQPIGSVR
jgi:hypothetical protein